MKILVLFIFQITDGILTAHWYSQKIGVELNPAMAWALEQGIPTFLFIKFSLTILCCGALLLMRNLPSAAFAQTFLLGLYSMVMILHCLIIF